jgi:hypothetical protein
MLNDMQLVILMILSSMFFFWINWTLVGWIFDHKQRIEKLEEENERMREEMEGIRERVKDGRV